MHNSAWIALLRHIPPDQQNQFMMMTTGGTEIAIHSFLLIDQECVVVKGRLSGSQDQGRVFFIPYARLELFGFSKPIKDEEFTAVFGDLSLPAQPLPRPVHETNGHAVSPAPEPEPEPEPEPTPVEPSAGDSRPAIRSEVLERFRSRLSLPSPVAASGLANPQRGQP